MAKQKSNHIALEIEEFEKKIKEFQKYLAKNDINKLFDDTVKGKEIEIQIKLMNAIPNLLDQLSKLREVQEKEIEARGDAEISGFAKEFIKRT